MTPETEDAPAPRKKRQRQPRTKGLRTIHEAGAALRRLWQDPEWREALLAKRQIAITKARAEGRWRTRFGIFDGYTREECAEIWALARTRAEKVITKMREDGTITEQDDPRVVKAFQAAVEVMDTPANQGLKLQAARLIMDFLKAKPTSKQEVTVKSAEDWLDAVTAAANE